MLLALAVGCAAHAPRNAVALSAAPAPAYVFTPAPLGQYVEIGDFDDEGLMAMYAGLIERLEAGDKVIYFRINSFGGSIFGGLDYMRVVNDVRKAGIRTVCVVDTRAYSMGAVFLEGACDERYLTKRSTLLFHNGSTEAAGNANDLREAVALLDALNRSMALVVAGRLGMALDEYEARIAKHSWILAADEALAVGAVDGVVEST